MKNKSDAHDRYRTYEAWAKTHRGVAAIEELQSDRGGEYLGHEFTAHLEAEGTTRRLTVHDSPQQNGKAERLNRTLSERARALLFDARLPKFLWGEAILHAAWLRNRTSSKNTPGTTPHELATGEKLNLADLPRFGATAWVLQEDDGKLEPKSKAGRWVGYDQQSKGHRIYWPERRTVSIERNVRIEPDDDTVVTVHAQAEGEHSPEGGLGAPAPPPSPAAQPPNPASQSPNSSPHPSTPPTEPKLDLDRPAYDTSNDGMFPVPLMRHLCNVLGEYNADLALLCAQPSQKTFRTKRILAKASRQNR